MAEVIKRIATHLDQSLTERDQVILSYMKQCLPDATKRRSPSLLKVLARDHSIYVSTPDVDKWKKNYDRRQEMLHSGFFTPNNRPYQCVGKLILDNQELLSGCLSSEKQESLKKLLAKKYQIASTGQIRLNIGKKKVEDIPGLLSKHCHPTYRNGYQHIKNYLEELQKIHNAVASNQPLSSCVKVPKALSSLAQRKASRRVSLEDLKSISGKHTSYPSDADGSSTQKEILTKLLEIGTDDPEEREQIRIYLRNRQYILEKLQIIYLLLCGLTSMRTIDLKILKPLSQEHVKILTKDVLSTKKNVSCFVPPIHTKNNTRFSFGPGLEDLRYTTVEMTWESLLNEKCLSIRKRDSKSTPARIMGSGRAHNLISKSIKQALKDSEFKAEDLPPWLAFLWEEFLIPDLSSGRLSIEDKIACIRKQRAAFYELQQSLNKMTYKTLLDKKRNQVCKMKMLLESLELQPEDHIHSILSSMKNLTKTRRPMENPPPWFTELENKCWDCVGEMDEEINSHLKKEKLCLLTLSLPAPKLLSPIVQDALIFILEEILQQPAEQLKIWYRYRKLQLVALI